ncbi:MAG: tetratricopeptide repeat protein [Blastocatellia bacterium]
MKKKRRKPVATKPATPQVPDSTRSSPLLSTGRLAVLLAVLAVVPYVNAFSNDFALDDIPIIVENTLIRDLRNVGALFTTNYWGEGDTARDRGLYRPLTVFTYAIDYAFWGLKPIGYHLVNLVLHAAVTLLLFVIAMNILRSAMAAFIAAAIFAVHPVHTEAVTGIVGRAEVLAALLFMLAFLFGQRYGVPRLRTIYKPLDLKSPTMSACIIAALFYFFGLLSKETAVALPAIILVHDLTAKDRADIQDKKNRSKTSMPALTTVRYVGFGIALLVYLAMRNSVVVKRNIWSGFVGVPVDERVLTASRVLMEYLALLIYPRTLIADYWKPDVPIARSAAEPLVLLSLLLWVLLGVVAVWSWRRARSVFFCLTWFFITIFPVSNILLAIGVGKAERILYLPSAGFCLVIGALFALVEKKMNKSWLIVLALIPVLLLFSIRTYTRNADWKDNMTLALATLKVTPTSPLFNQIAASEYRKLGENDKATPFLQEAIRQRPEEHSYHYNLGNVYLDLKQYDLAVASYQEALRLKPGYLEAMNNLGQAQMEKGNNAEAVKTYTALLSKDRSYLKAYLNLGAAYFNLENFGEAARVLREGLTVAPDFGGLHLNLSAVLQKMGQGQEAAQEYQKAISLDPSLKETN